MNKIAAFQILILTLLFTSKGITQTCTVGNAIAELAYGITVTGGSANPTNAQGAILAAGTTLNTSNSASLSDANPLVIDLGRWTAGGATFTVAAQRNGAGTATARVEYSLNGGGAGYVTLGTLTLSAATSTHTNFTVPSGGARYFRIVRTGTAPVNLFVDGVSYTHYCPSSVAIKDDIVVLSPGTAVGNVTGNDKINGNIIQLTQLTSPAHGTLNFTAATGMYTYMPNMGYEGLDFWNYQLCDPGPDGNINTTGDNNCTTATVSFRTIFNCKTTVFYVPMPENESRDFLEDINTGNDDPTTVYIGVALSGEGFITYDHWEDGYEADITFPMQSTTQIWGDGDLTNGVAPGFPNDMIPPGKTVILTNTLTSGHNNTNTYNPNAPGADNTLQSVIDYDGRDKLYIAGEASMAKFAWGTAGTLSTSSSAVPPTRDWGTNYVLPVGTNTPNAGNMFSLASLSIIAKDNNTTVNIDRDANGSVDITMVLNEGETYYVDSWTTAQQPILEGATISATKPVQVMLMSGDQGSTYAGRTFALVPTNMFASTYYMPTVLNETMRVYFYNPTGSSITVTRTTNPGPTSTNITVPAMGTAFDDANNLGVGYEYTSTVPFGILSTVDFNSAISDWGFTPVPETNMSPVALLSFAEGSDPTNGAYGTNNYSQAFVTPKCNTYIYVDLNGDGTPDKVSFNDDIDALDAAINIGGVNYNETTSNQGILVNKYQTITIGGTNGSLNGAKIWTRTGPNNTGPFGCDLAVVWGQNGGPNGAPNIDAGYTLPKTPLPLDMNVSYPTSVCVNNTNESIAILALNGTAPYTILVLNKTTQESHIISTMSMSSTFDASNPGNYVVKAHDTNCLEFELNFTVLESANCFADLSIVKTDGVATYTAGTTTTYTVVASNAGPLDAFGTTVTDVAPAGTTISGWNAVFSGGATGMFSGSGNINTVVNLPVGGTVTYTITLNIPSGFTGNLINTANVISPMSIPDPIPGNNSSTDTDTPAPRADLSITKTDGVATYTAGTTTTYTVIASNAGPSNVTGATVTDNAPAGTTITGWTAVFAGGASGTANGSGNISQSINLPVGGTATYTITLNIPSNVTGNLVNTVTVAVPVGTTDPTPGNNSATDTDTPAPVSDLSITKTDGVATYTAGTTTTYTVVASNAGPSNVTGATVTDNAPAGTTITGWTAVFAGGASGTAIGSGNISQGINLPVGGTATYTITLNIPSGVTGNLVNTASIAVPVGTTDPTPGNNSATDTDTPNPQADLSITKTDGVATYTAGTTTTYTVVASNAGPSNVTGATVTDNAPAGTTITGWTAVFAGGASGTANGSGNISQSINLPVGGTATYTITLNIPSNVTGNLVNTATVAVPVGTTDPTPGNNSATDTDTPNPQADLSITKTDGVATYTAGTTTTYTVVASNAGPSNVTGATVTDNAPAGTTITGWTAVFAGGATGAANGTGNISQNINLPVGGTATYTITLNIPSNVTGNLVNTATVAVPVGTTDPTPGNNSATDTDTPNPQADLSITKTDGVATYTAGTTTTYTVVASNAGPSNVTGATVTDNAPAGTTITSWSAVYAGGATGAANGTGNISQSINLPVGGTATYTITLNIPSNVTGNLVNTATVAVPVGTTDPTPGNNSATDTDTNNPQADLSITKTDGVATYTAGTTTTYTVVASNAGPSNVTGATVTDNAPAGTTITSWTAVFAGGASGTANGSGNISQNVNLPVGGTATYTITLNIPSGVTGNLVNTASIAVPVGTTDPTPGNNSATDTDTPNPQADLSITKTDGVATYTAGTTTTYTVVASNAGPSNVTGATVTDNAPAGTTITGWTAVFAGGASGTANGSGNISQSINLPVGGTATYTITLNIPSNVTGNLVNTATVAVPVGTTDPTPGNNSATDTDTPNPQADLSITKTDGVATYTAGTTTTYTVVASNAGPSNVTGATVTDNAPAGTTITGWTAVFAGGATGAANGTGNISQNINLPVGGTATYTITLNIPSGVTGNLVNTASIAVPVGTTDPTPGNNSATDTDTPAPVSDLGIVKTVDNSTPSVGSNVTFTLLVTNYGPSDATGVIVNDLLPNGYTYVSDNGLGAYNNVTGVWTIGNLTQLASSSLQITVTVNQPSSEIDYYLNKSQVSGDQPDNVPTNNYDDEPTFPTVMPSVDIAKQVTGLVKAASGIVGNYDVSYRMVLKNTGNVDLRNLVLTDNLQSQFGVVFVGITGQPAITGGTATTNPGLNGSYTGGTDNMFNGTSGLLEPGQTITVTLRVEVNPSANPSLLILNNQATIVGSAVNILGAPILDPITGLPLTATDISDSGAIPDSTNPGEPGDSGGPDDPTPLQVPSINVVKRVVSVTKLPNSNYNIRYRLKVGNTGNTVLENITLVDDIAAQLGTSYIGVTTAPSIIGANTSASVIPTLGSFPINIFNGSSGKLNPRDSVTVEFVIQVNPDAAGAPDPLDNQATTGGIPTNGSGVPLENPNTGVAYVAGQVTDDSDSGVQLESTNPGEPGDTGGPDDPTPVVIPSVDIAKQVTGLVKAASGIVGNYDVSYRMVLKNTGNVDLRNLVLTDNLQSQFGVVFVGITGQPAITGGTATTNPGLNGSYTGGTDNMFNGTSGLLEPGQTITVTLRVEVNPSANPSLLILNNQATIVGSAVNNLGAPILDPITGLPLTATDISDSGAIPDSTNPGEPGDSGGPDDPTPLQVPSINVVKRVVSVTKLPNSNYNIRYRLKVGNTGNTVLENITLVDDIAAQLGTSYIGVTTAPSIIGANTSASVIPTLGSFPINIFNGSSGKLNPRDSVTVEFVIQVNPDAAGAPDPLDNQATTGGIPTNGSGVPLENPNTGVAYVAGQVTDDSDSGVQLESTNPGEPGDTGGPDDPTPVVIPSVDIAKQVTGLVKAASGIVGNYDVSYRMVLKNTGNVDLRNLVLTDNLQSQFGVVFVGITGQPAITGGTATTNPGLNGSYTGGTDNMFNGTSGLLEPGQTITVTLRVEVNPSANPSLLILNNQATIVGSAVNILGAPILDPITGLPLTATDISDSGAIPDSTNPGEPGDSGGPDDPTPLQVPSINVVKRVVSVTKLPNSNYNIRYRLKVGNTGNTVLENITLVDDIAAQLGTSYIGVTTAPSIIGANTSASVIPTLGFFPINIFNGSSGKLNPRDSVTVEFVIQVNPDAAGAPDPLDNQATTGGIPTNGSGVPLENPNTGVAYVAGQVTDDSDSGVQLESTNPGEPGDTGGPDDPTPVVIPSVDIAKQVTGLVKAASGIVGNYDVSYRMVLKNTGNVDLRNLVLTDNLQSQFGVVFVGITGQPAITGGTATTNPGLNGSYTGGTDNMFNGTSGLLEPGQTITVTLRVEVNPSANPSLLILNNQATIVGSAVNILGAPILDPITGLPLTATDISDSGAIPDSTNPGEPGDSGGPDDPTPLQVPSINVVKRVVSVTKLPNSNYNIRYRLKVGNTGNTVLENITLVDDIAAQLGTSYVGVTTAPSIIGANTSASVIPTLGFFPINIFNGSSGKLNPRDSVTVEFVIQVNPDAAGAPDPLDNQATTGGIPTNGSGVPLENPNTGVAYVAGQVTDDSDSGVQLESTNPGEPGDTGGPDDPTPVVIPSVDIAKQVTGLVKAASGIVGNYDVNYTMVLKNTGNVDLRNLVLTDNLQSQFGVVFVGITGQPAITGGTATTNPGLNGSYTGGTDNMFNGTSGLLEPGQTITVTLRVEVNPSANPSLLILNNQATIVGSAVNNLGAPILDPITGLPLTATDISDSGAIPDSTNPGEPGDSGGPDDPTPLQVPSINVVKSVVSVTKLPNSNYNIRYRLKVGNTGNTVLESITLVDDVVGQLGSAYVGVTSGPVVNIGTTTASIIPALGSFPMNVFNGTSGKLNPGQIVEVEFVIQVNPDAVGAPSPMNNLAVAGGIPTNGNGLPLENPITGNPYIPGQVTDNSDSGTILESTNPGEPGDTGGPDDPTPVVIPSVDIAKQVTGLVKAASGIVGNYDVNYTMVLKNTGNVDLRNLVLTDNLQTQFGPAFVSISGQPALGTSTATTNPTLNGAYTGSNDNMFNGTSGLLKPGQTITVTLKVQVNPNAPGANLVLNNQATIVGSAVNALGNPINGPNGQPLTATDISDSGAIPDSTNPGEPGDSGGPNDPTPLQVPSINVVKNVVSVTKLANSNYNVRYRLRVGNTGNTVLENITLVDDIVTQLGSAYVSVAAAPTINVGSTTAAVTPVLGVFPINIFNGTSGKLNPGQIVEVEFVIQVNPDAAGAPDPLDNQATTGGIPTNGSGVPLENPNTGVAYVAGQVTDDSDSGVQLESTNPGESGDTGGPDDPTPVQIPSIDVVKSIVSVTDAISQIPGNKDVKFRFTVQNSGNLDLTAIDLIDPIMTELLPVWVGIAQMPSVVFSNATTNPVLNGIFNGNSQPNMFNGTSGLLKPGQSVTVELTVQINPNASHPNYPALTNQATANGDATLLNGSVVTVTDISDDGINTQGTNPDYPGDMTTPDDPTPLIAPAISLVKNVVDYLNPLSGTSGHNDVIINLGLKNVGNVHLSNIRLMDTIELPKYVGIYYVGLAPGTQPMIISSNATTNPVINPGYNGRISNPGIFNGTTGLLAPGQEMVVQIRIEINANSPLIPDSLWNRATVYGDAARSNGSIYTVPGTGNPITTTDNSDAGTQHESTNPSQPEDEGTAQDNTLIQIRPGTIGDFVWHDLNGNGQQDAGEPGIPGVQVNLYRADGVYVTTVYTDIMGKYLFENIRPGNVYLEFKTPTGYERTFMNRGDDNSDSDMTGVYGPGTTPIFNLSSGSTNLTVDAGFYKCIPIGDLVWYDINKNDVWNTNENGVNGLKVNLWRNHFGNWIIYDFKFTGQKPGSPSDDGYFAFCAPPGEYQLEVVMPPLGLVRARPNVGTIEEFDSDIQSNGRTDIFQVVSGSSKTDIGAGFYPMAQAGNLVWRDDNVNGMQDASEPKVKGVKVEAIELSTRKVAGTTYTDSDGIYTIDYLEKQQYYMKFTPPVGYGATIAKAGPDNMDSDVDHTFGAHTTRAFSFESGMINENIDMGIAFGVLPVDWLDVNAKRISNTHVISWNTAREVNVSHYEVERKLDSETDFKVIPGQIKANGNTTQTSDYSHVDNDVDKPGVYVYRVKQVDYDGLFTYSKLVKLSHIGQSSIDLYPNPAKNETNIQVVVTEDASVMIELYDGNSKLVRVLKNADVQLAGDVLYHVSLEDIASGVYNVVVTIDGVTTQKKLIRIQ